MVGEEWFDLPGGNGLYQISTLCRIRSFVKDPAGRIMKLSNSQGYKCFTYYKNGKRVRPLLHREYAKMFIPNTENKPCINHINAIKTDNRIENLEWCTRAENNRHAVKMGLHRGMIGKSECARTRILTPDQVREIRLKYKPRKYPMKKLAEEYGTAKGNIKHIVRRRTWKLV